MSVLNVYRVGTIVFLLLGGVGIALNLTLLEGAETRLQILVAGMTAASFFIAGFISPRLLGALFCPAVMLVSLAVAFTVYDEGYYDTEPLIFAVILSVIYGALASVIFAAGWLVRRAVCQIRTRTIQCREIPMRL